MVKTKELKVLIVSMHFNYGDPAKGVSYDWNHFYMGLKPHFHTVDFFDYMDLSQSLGREKMQKELLKKVQNNGYDITIFVLYTDQFERAFIDSLKKHTKTFAFFHDDTWRQDFVKYWGPCFDAFTTTDIHGVKKYTNKGLKQAVFVPFGVNERLFNPGNNVVKDIDVSFIGAKHPYRAWLLKILKKAGFDVTIYGYGWPNGILNETEMVDIFRRSKISLNLSNSVSYDVRYLMSSPMAIINTLRSKKKIEQLKGRHFEIPACESLQLSYYVEGLESVFNIGKEIGVYVSSEDLVAKIDYYLENDEEREQIAEAGYQRIISEHTYFKRFMSVFVKLGWCSNNE